MRPRHNVIDETPVVPVRWHDDAAPNDATGERPQTLHLRDTLLDAHHIDSLDVTQPPAHAALLRILYALTARVTGLDRLTGEAWAERRLDVLAQGRLSERAVDAYSHKYRDRFFLVDPDGGRPWMQDARLASQCDSEKTAGVNKLIVTRSSGNNHAWFSHVSDARPDFPTVQEAVLNLLVWHYYGPSGRCSAREVNGIKSASASAGPLRTALSYHPIGESLFHTLLAGLVPPSVADRLDGDLCPWEWEELPDPDGPPVGAHGPCSRLTACSQHALLLVPHESDTNRVADAYITWAYRTGRGVRAPDDYLIWQVSKQGNTYPRPAAAGRALWRDVDALLLKEAPGTAQPRQPRVFESAFEVSEYLRVRALGFDQDGQAKDRQFVDASTPPLLGHVEERAPRTDPAVGRLRALGELYGYRLDQAVRRAWSAYTRDSKADAGRWRAEAAARYWPAAEREFWTRFRTLDRSGHALDAGFDAAAARRAFLRISGAAYETVTDRVTRTLRGAEAVAQARPLLVGGRRKTAPGSTNPPA